MTVHEPATHPAVACAGVGQGVHDAPHVEGDVLSAHAPEQRWKPESHAKPQFVPSHVGMEFGGTGHDVHDVPHDDVDVLLAHMALAPLPHACVPDPQVNPHVPPRHVAVPPDGALHAFEHAPQLFTSVLVLAHDVGHTVSPDGHVNAHEPPVQVGVPIAGAVQAFVHDPQCDGFVIVAVHTPPQFI